MLIKLTAEVRSSFAWNPWLSMDTQLPRLLQGTWSTPDMRWTRAMEKKIKQRANCWRISCQRRIFSLSPRNFSASLFHSLTISLTHTHSHTVAHSLFTIYLYFSLFLSLSLSYLLYLFQLSVFHLCFLFFYAFLILSNFLTLSLNVPILSYIISLSFSLSNNLSLSLSLFLCLSQSLSIPLYLIPFVKILLSLAKLSKVFGESNFSFVFKINAKFSISPRQNLFSIFKR